LTDSIDVIGHTADHFAIRMVIKISQGQATDLPGDILAQAVDQLLGNAGHNPALQISKY